MQIRFTTTVATAALLVIGGVVMPTAQRSAPSAGQSSAAQQEVATFRSSVTLVQIDAIVTDASGAPVSGLTEADFEVTEARQSREILSVAEINIPPPVPDPLASLAEPDMATNRTPPGRKYVIALGPVNSNRVLRARHALRDFVDRHLGPYDVAAVALVNRGLSTSGQDFTSNRRLLRAAIDRFSGDAPDDTAVSDATTEPAQTTQGFVAPPSSPDAFQLAASLRSLIEAVAKVPGRKVLVYVGEGMGTLNAHAARDYNGSTLTPAEREFHAAIAAATRGNITIYPIDPRGLTSDSTAPMSERNVEEPTDLETRADLAAIADVTGGFALSSSNNFDGAFTRIVEENSRFYTIGFSSEHARRDGKFVPVTVRVKRPGLTVRARNGYVAPLGKARTTGSTDGMPAVTQALASPLPVTEVPLRVVAAAYRGRNAEASVALVVELDVASLDLVEQNGRYTADLQLSYLATDATGKVKPGKRVKVKAAVPKPALSQPVLLTRAITELSLPQGRYQLRVAVGDESRAGSVVYDLEIPDFRREALTLSGVSLTTASAPSVATVKLQDLLGTALPGPPVATRDFSRQDALGLYAEVYDKRRRGTPTVSADLRTKDNVVVRTFNQIRLGPALRTGADAHGITAVTSLAGLEPGAYVLHLEARVESSSVKRDIPVHVF